MAETESDKGTQAPAVGRAVRILDFLAGAGGHAQSLSEIARELLIAKSSTANLCAALEEGGLIRRADGGYLLGRRLVELGGAYLSTFDQVREFYRICEDSPVLSRNLVQIAMLDGPRVIYLAVYEGHERFPLSASVGDRYPASATAVGTALLSELDPHQVEALYGDDRHLVTFTERSTATIESLQTKLEQTRERGYAIDIGEVHPNVVGIAVLVKSLRHGDPSFGLGVSLVRPHVSTSDQEEVLVALQGAAHRLSVPTFQDELPLGEPVRDDERDSTLSVPL